MKSKFEARNSKRETISKVPMFGKFEFRISDLFRISDFGVRVLRPLQNSRGSYMILMAIMTIIFAAIGGMIFEMHKSMALRTHMQNVADLAALAAAREYTDKDGAVTLNQIYTTVQGVVNENAHWLGSGAKYELDETSDGIMVGHFEGAELTQDENGSWKDYQFTVFNGPFAAKDTGIKDLSPPANMNSVRVVLKSNADVTAQMFQVLGLSGELKAEGIAQFCSDGSVSLYGACTARCGNGAVDSGEQCDDGNAADDGNGCTTTCQCAAGYMEDPSSNGCISSVCVNDGEMLRFSGRLGADGRLVEAAMDCNGDGLTDDTLSGELPNGGVGTNQIKDVCVDAGYKSCTKLSVTGDGDMAIPKATWLNKSCNKALQAPCIASSSCYSVPVHSIAGPPTTGWGDCEVTLSTDKGAHDTTDSMDPATPNVSFDFNFCIPNDETPANLVSTADCNPAHHAFSTDGGGTPLWQSKVSCACPSSPICGDGSVDAGEQCDDWGTISGDGCSATCQCDGANPNFSNGHCCPTGQTWNGIQCAAAACSGANEVHWENSNEGPGQWVGEYSSTGACSVSAAYGPTGTSQLITWLIPQIKTDLSACCQALPNTVDGGTTPPYVTLPASNSSPIPYECNCAPGFSWNGCSCLPPSDGILTCTRDECERGDGTQFTCFQLDVSGSCSSYFGAMCTNSGATNSKLILDNLNECCADQGKTASYSYDNSGDVHTLNYDCV